MRLHELAKAVVAHLRYNGCTTTSSAQLFGEDYELHRINAKDNNGVIAEITLSPLGVILEETITHLDRTNVEKGFWCGPLSALAVDEDDGTVFIVQDNVVCDLLVFSPPPASVIIDNNTGDEDL